MLLGRRKNSYKGQDKALKGAFIFDHFTVQQRSLIFKEKCHIGDRGQKSIKKVTHYLNGPLLKV